MGRLPAKLACALDVYDKNVHPFYERAGARVMTGADFIKAIRELGRRRGVAVAVDTKRGKGSHVALYFGERRTIVQDRKKDIPRPTLKSMLRDLGLTERELP